MVRTTPNHFLSRPIAGGFCFSCNFIAHKHVRKRNAQRLNDRETLGGVQY